MPTAEERRKKRQARQKKKTAAIDDEKTDLQTSDNHATSDNKIATLLVEN
jgi:hypothetical protein